MTDPRYDITLYRHHTTHEGGEETTLITCEDEGSALTFEDLLTALEPWGAEYGPFSATGCALKFNLLKDTLLSDARFAENTETVYEIEILPIHEKNDPAWDMNRVWFALEPKH